MQRPEPGAGTRATGRRTSTGPFRATGEVCSRRQSGATNGMRNPVIREHQQSATIGAMSAISRYTRRPSKLRPRLHVVSGERIPHPSDIDDESLAPPCRSISAITHVHRIESPPRGPCFARGYRRIHDWIDRLDCVERVGVEQIRVLPRFPTALFHNYTSAPPRRSMMFK